jgi:thiosulfate/3-mercaptopyruvate sulfurtransferase
VNDSRCFLSKSVYWFMPILLCIATMSFGQTAKRPELLVSSAWLAEHLNDPSVVILHISDDRGDYNREHIPGARFLSPSEFTTGHEGMMVELPDVEKLKNAFEGAGISDDTKVVIYATGWYPEAARAFFTLDYLGHTNSALLNGSIAQWKKEKRQVTAEASPVKMGKITVHVNESARALLADAKAATQSGASTLLVDSRPERRYTAGHLPGADHVFWEETVANANDPVLKSPEELQNLFQSRGIKPGAKLITYCEVGLQASHVYFVARYLGYDAAMYDGSFYEWNEMDRLPVVKGGNPR